MRFLFEILSKLVYRKKDQTNEILNQLRQQIDEYDYELIELLAKRMSVCREIGEYKKEKAISIVQNKRYDEIMSSRVLRANQLGLSSEFIVKVLESVHTESIRQQIDVFRKG